MIYKLSMGYVGQSVPRKEGIKKVKGEAVYIDDLVFPGMLYGVTVRSSIARGRIKKITFAEDIPWGEFTVVRAKDIPGKNHVTLLTNDQPFLAEEFVNHPEEAILLLAHPDRYMAEKGRQSITIEYEKYPAVFTIEESLAKSEIIWGKDNIFKTYLIEKGQIDSVWKKADHIIEDEYFTEAQEQLYIENQGMIAQVNHEGVTVWGSMQCPYYVHKALCPLFDFPAEKIRIIQTETGGGFGGKEEYPSLLAGHAALLAWKSKRPVKMIYSRSEDMVATTKRHPSRTRHKTAVSNDGKLLGMEIDFVIDGGAYNTLSPVVLSRGTIHASGPYKCDHIRVKSRAVATSAPPHGAFRGFGAPQSIFALERHLDKVAKTLGLTPEALRLKNFIKKGDTTATGQLIREEVQLDLMLKKAFDLTDYQRKRRAFSKINPKSNVKKGIGFATFMHGAGFTGSGEKKLASVVGLEADREGKIRILTASTEIGQGTNTIFAQIVADALGVEYETIEMPAPDTRFVPDSGPTVASRTCMIVGKLVESAAIGLKQNLIHQGLLKEKYSSTDFRKACATYVGKFGNLKVYSQYQQPPHVEWNDDTYQGEAYATYAWAVYVAEVSVDTVTFEIKVDDFVALQEVGRVIHPTLAAGQIEGGVAQGIGYALYEKVVWNEGRMANGQMTNYIMPTSMDLPAIRVFFDEKNQDYGPSGAKGIGELPMDGPAPALLNAIENATGVSVKRIPVLPEDLMDLLKNA